MVEESFCLKRFPSKMFEQKCSFKTKMSEQKSWFETKMLGHNYCFQPKMSEHKFLFQSKCLNKIVASKCFECVAVCSTFTKILGPVNVNEHMAQRKWKERKHKQTNCNVNGTLMVLTPLFRGPRQKII